ncbi:MAG TPA: dephospho-CoA kinase [Thermoanaerobaculia bacterium]|nr:dephospho-CoA kinase [Thermoanaerobaculia bacterium]
MIRVGLTGGLASGKSTVAARLEKLGAEVFDADQIVAELYVSGGPGEAAAWDLFGDAVFDDHGAIDRGRLARLVFSDPEKRRALESRIHPLVGTEIARRFAEAERRGAAVAVAEASQLLEAKKEGPYDRVLLVVAPETERVRRWTAKGGDANDARRRMAAQIPPEEARRRATDVIVNDGTVEELERKVDELFGTWIE